MVSNFNIHHPIIVQRIRFIIKILRYMINNNQNIQNIVYAMTLKVEFVIKIKFIIIILELGQTV